jgi:hypothetical protein
MSVDGNLNGVVDAADYVVWRQALSTAASGGAAISAATIPEPASMMLGLLGVSSSAMFRRFQMR